MKYIVDKVGTEEYISKYNEPCNCIYCRNYYNTFPQKYPLVVELLKKMGLTVERALEVMEFYWDESGVNRIYVSYYAVKGEIFEDKTVIYSKDAIVTLYLPTTDEDIYKNTNMLKPYFILEIDNIKLPWVLEEKP